MKKHLLIAIALAFVAGEIQAQTTTIGGGGQPVNLDNGYTSDYSTAGTVVLSDGLVIMINSSIYEHGNTLLQNDGTWTSSSGSNDLFVAPGVNTISGSNAPAFFNADFSMGVGSAMNITNTAGINIAGQLAFNNGITSTVRSNTTAGAIHFAAGSTYTGGNSDVQHVNGYVSKAGTTAFTFPVGSGADLRTLAITAPSTPTALSVAWFAGSPSSVTDPSDGSIHSVNAFAAPLMAVSHAGFWDWIPVAGNDDGVTVAVSIPNLSFFAGASDLRLAGWNGTQWIDLSGGQTASGNTENSTLTGIIPVGSTITAIGIASVTTPLAVHFSSFTAAANNCTVQLNWETGSEQNSDYFTVTRSDDGIQFRDIARVQARGNTGGPYAYKDEAPLPGLSYYRIRETALDGSTTYTAVRSVHPDCGTEDIRVYPTVTGALVHIELPEADEPAQFLLLNELGQQMSCVVDGMGTHKTLDLAPLPAAQYLLQVQYGGTVQTFKLIRE